MVAPAVVVNAAAPLSPRSSCRCGCVQVGVTGATARVVTALTTALRRPYADNRREFFGTPVSVLTVPARLKENLLVAEGATHYFAQIYQF